MAYVPSQFNLMYGDMQGKFRMWVLDTSDAAADVDTAAYVSDGYTRGARKGDLVLRRTWAGTVDTTGNRANWGALSTWGWHMVKDESTASVDLTDTTTGTMTDTD